VIVCGCLPKINSKRLRSVYKGDFLTPANLEKIDGIARLKLRFSQIKEPHVLRDFDKTLPSMKNIICTNFLDEMLAHLKNKNIGVSRSKETLQKEKLAPYTLDYPGRFYLRKKVYNIQVATGCLGRCAYCAIKFAVGKLKSKSLPEIISDFKKGLQKGFTQFTITAEDVGAYGMDQGSDVVNLFKKLFSIDGNYKLLIQDINMNWLLKYSDALIPLLKKNQDKIDYIVIPLRKIKKEMPNLKICTHVMVGFPGESEKDFRETLDIMKAYPFCCIDIYEYTDRPNTVASKMSDKISEKIKKRRYQEAVEARYKLYRNNRFYKVQ